MNARTSRFVSAATRLLPAALAALLLSAGLITAGPAGTASAADDVTWGVRTASNANGTDRQNFAYTIKPGATVSDALVISNHDAAPLKLEVYAADGFTTSSGQLDLLTPDKKSVAVGAWTALRGGTLTVAAGKTVQVPFTVTVPSTATPGDYAGGILTSLPHTSQENGISVDRRLGIRMHVRVGGALAPSVAVEKLHVDYTGTFNPFGTGAATIAYTVHNTGNVRLAAGQTVALTGPFGWFPVEVEGVAPVPELLPGESWTVSVPVSGVVPAFWLSATTTLNPQLPAVSGVTPGLDGVRSSGGTVAIPWALLVLVLLVAAAVVGTVFLLRARRRRSAAREDERVKKAVEAALRESESASASEPSAGVTA